MIKSPEKPISYDPAPERMKMLMADPHLVAFSHLSKHWVAGPGREGPHYTASTDGTNVFYGDQYRAMPPEERAYVFSHEQGHIILRHPDRSMMLRLTTPNYQHGLFNLAADGVLNEGITACGGGVIKPPTKNKPVMMSFIHKAMSEAIEYTGAVPPSHYDPQAIKSQNVERVCGWLHWAFEETRRKRKEERDACPEAQRRKGAGEDGDQDESAPQAASGGDPDKSDDRSGAGRDEATPERAADQGDGDGGGQESDGDRNGESPPEDADHQCGDAEGAVADAPSRDREGGGRGGKRPMPDGGGREDPSGAPSGERCTCGQCPRADGQPADDGRGGDGSLILERYASGGLADLEEQTERLRELLKDGKTIDEIIREASERVDQARAAIAQIVAGIKQQGVGSGSMLLAFEHDLPPPVVPWHRLLRKEITRGLSTRLDDCYDRFGQKTTYALASGASLIPYTPGTTIFTPAARVLVVLDVSGSHIPQITRCFSEIRSIARKRRAVVDVLTFDHGVQELITIGSDRDFRTILKRGLAGGGGTVLGDVWDRIARMRDKYRLAIVMTDGELNPGEAPDIPVLWMITPGGRTEFPYGKVISLPDYMTTADARLAA